MRLRQTGPQEAPPPTPESIAAAWADLVDARAALAAHGVRLRDPREPPVQAPRPLGDVPLEFYEQRQQVAAIEQIGLLVAQFGAARVQRWLDHVTQQLGETR